MTQTLVKTIADFSTTLVSKVTVGDTTATLTSGLDEDGVQLPTGTYGFTIDRNNSQKEHFTATLTGSALTNIKHVTRGTGTASTGFANTHRKGAEVVITDHVALKRIMDVLDGTTQFDSATILGYDGTATATTPNQLITKAQLDATALGSVTVTTVVLPGNAGETVSAGNLLYLDVADGEWKKCDADTAATVDNIILGIAQGAGTDGVAITGGVMLQGLDTNQSGLTTNTAYYASNTAGAITSTPGTTEVSVGVSRSTTSLLFFPRYNQQLTENQQDALAGTSGTPSATNKFVTNDDTATSGAGKILRLDGSGKYPANDGSQITGVAISQSTVTAGENISALDAVYVSAADTVKTYKANTIGTPANITTDAAHNTAELCFPLSTSGKFIKFTGGNYASPAALYGQVGTINAAETDISWGAEATVYNTGNGVRSFSGAVIGTDKIALIFQCSTAGAPAGLKVAVCTVSGTTITVGTVYTIESTGVLTNIAGIAKLDTDKAVISYMADSDADLYVKTLSVSGTVVTQNTAYSAKVHTGDIASCCVQVGTDSAIVFYGGVSSNESTYAKKLSVSGTVITLGAEQTIRGTTSALNAIAAASVSSSKVVFAMASTGNFSNVYNVAISGDTLTASTALSIGSAIARTIGLSVISDKLLAAGLNYSATAVSLYLVDISSTNPSTITSTTGSHTSDTTYYTGAIAKISPWTYYLTGCNASSDGAYIVKLSNSSIRSGVCISSISSAASGTMVHRHLKQGGFTSLTAGSNYYVDDSGQPTTNSSLSAPAYGLALNTTTFLLQ